MQLEIRNNRDVWAGAMLIATGAASVIIARDYSFGTSLRMGPGYFPSVLGGLLVQNSGFKVCFVGGYVTGVFVQDNDSVPKGKLLVSIDDAEYKVKVAQAEADLAAAQSTAGGRQSPFPAGNRGPCRAPRRRRAAAADRTFSVAPATGWRGMPLNP